MAEPMSSGTLQLLVFMPMDGAHIDYAHALSWLDSPPSANWGAPYVSDLELGDGECKPFPMLPDGPGLWLLRWDWHETRDEDDFADCVYADTCTWSRPTADDVTRLTTAHPSAEVPVVEPIQEVWVVRNGGTPLGWSYVDAHTAVQCALRHTQLSSVELAHLKELAQIAQIKDTESAGVWNMTVERLPIATPEMVADAERYQYVRRFFSVETSMDDGYYREFLFMHDDRVGEAEFSREDGNTVESLIDAARAGEVR